MIAPRTNATLTGLKKATNYSIKVFASTANGGGKRVSLLLSLHMKTVSTVSSGITQSVVMYSFGISRV